MARERPRGNGDAPRTFRRRRSSVVLALAAVVPSHDPHVGHRLLSWTASTSGHVLEIEFWAGVVSDADAASAQRFLDELLTAAYWEGNAEARRTVESIYRAVERREPPDPTDFIEAERMVREALAYEVRHGQLRLTARPRVSATSALGDGLINPFEDEAPVEPPPPDTTWFSIRVVDEVGDPVDGLDLQFEVLGETQDARTDGSGRARIEGMQGGTALVTVVSASRLQQIMAPRWTTPRTPVLPEDAPDAPVVLERLDDHFDPVRLARELETTLVILPRFACREIAASTFDFGRSFVRREGILAMANIAEELQQEDGQLGWIFGHTDMAGPELVNKRLSERRAKAIFAVFTHDFAKWDEMWRGTVNESPWSERWGTREMQHMLNTLRCPDDAGDPLGEDGNLGGKTQQAIRRFKRKDYPDVPSEQAALPDNATVDAAFREQLFLAYAKLIARDPVDPTRIAPVGAAAFMGCGEYNPLSLTAHDRESRRTVVFVFDPAAQPQAPPCVLGDVKPCKAQLDPPPDADAPGPYYRCRFYQSIATCCQSAGGADLAHDVIVRFFMNLQTSGSLGHRFILEAQDEPDDDDPTPPFSQEHALADDARAVVEEGAAPAGDDAGSAPPAPAAGPEMVELHFTHVPDAARYRLRVEGVASPYTVFTHTPFHGISELSRGLDVVRIPRLLAILNAPPPPDPFE